MIKNIILLGLLTWVSLSYAKKDHSVAHDSMEDAKSYKIEKAVEEQEATRSVAGSKIKKRKAPVKSEEGTSEEEFKQTDSEVRFWEYSE